MKREVSVRNVEMDVHLLTENWPPKFELHNAPEVVCYCSAFSRLFFFDGADDDCTAHNCV